MMLVYGRYHLHHYFIINFIITIKINDMNWASCSGGSAPCDASSNLNCAIKVFGWGGNTWKLWSTCGQCGVCNSN